MKQMVATEQINSIKSDEQTIELVNNAIESGDIQAGLTGTKIGEVTINAPSSTITTSAIIESQLRIVLGSTTTTQPTPTFSSLNYKSIGINVIKKSGFENAKIWPFITSVAVASAGSDQVLLITIKTIAHGLISSSASIATCEVYLYN